MHCKQYTVHCVNHLISDRLATCPKKIYLDPNRTQGQTHPAFSLEIKKNKVTTRKGKEANEEKISLTKIIVCNLF